MFSPVPTTFRKSNIYIIRSPPPRKTVGVRSYENTGAMTFYLIFVKKIVIVPVNGRGCMFYAYLQTRVRRSSDVFTVIVVIELI